MSTHDSLSDDENLLNSSPISSPADLPGFNSDTNNEVGAANTDVGGGNLPSGEQADVPGLFPASVGPTVPSAGQDFSQLAQLVAAQHRLDSENRQALFSLASMTHMESAFIWLGGCVLAIRENLARIQPPEAPVKLTSAVKNAIELECITVFLNDKAGSYKSYPNKKVLSTIKRDHLSASQATDKAVITKVKNRIGGKFIHFRNDTKDKISSSMGTFDPVTKKFTGVSVDVYDLTESIIRVVCGRNFTFTMTLQLVARIAYIRSIYATEAKKTVDGTVPGNFWNTVDASLREMRNDKEKDPVRISKVFLRYLDKDIKRYGNEETVTHVNTLRAQVPAARVPTADA